VENSTEAHGTLRSVELQLKIYTVYNTIQYVRDNVLMQIICK